MTERRRVDVAKLLSKLGIEAKLDGGEYLARCPGHKDAKPSWSINRETGRHHCFACGFGGTPASLVIHVLGVETLGWTRRDAWDWMTKHGLLEGDGELGLAVELYLRAPEPRDRIVMPGSVRTGPLATWPPSVARYVTDRGITAQQVRSWNIGYALDGRLAGRIVFPVFGLKGELLSYSARSFIGSEVRYLTPSEREHPDPAALFGMVYWPRHVGERRRIVVVEGAIKALAIERAMPGTAVGGLLGAVQARNTTIASYLSTFEEVVLAFDADGAGERGAQALYGALARHTRTRLVVPKVPFDEAPVDETRRALA